MNLEIIIPSDEPVRLLNAVTEELDYRRLTATYSRFGRIEYSPRLLFKIVLYGCSRGIYGTREIERACRENVNFMYLLEGHRPPDHNTIARFRKEHLPYAVEDLLNQMVKLLVAHGEISFEKSAVFIDGTKIEANANRYSFVWKTAVTKRQAKLGEKIAEELPKLLEASGTGIVAPYIITVQRLKKLRKSLYAKIVVDSGYESEENYNYVDGSEQLSLLVKPSDHEQKKKRKYKNDISRRENMAYDVEKDEYTCAQGKKLQAVGVKKRKSDTGYVQEMTVYECADCKGCLSGFVYCFLSIIGRFSLVCAKKRGCPERF